MPILRVITASRRPSKCDTRQLGRLAHQWSVLLVGLYPSSLTWPFGADLTPLLASIRRLVVPPPTVPSAGWPSVETCAALLPGLQRRLWGTAMGGPLLHLFGLLLPTLGCGARARKGTMGSWRTSTRHAHPGDAGLDI